MKPRHRGADASDISQEEMRRVAEEVAAWFPDRHEAPELMLLPVDPHHLHAYWTLDEAAAHAARVEAGSPYAPLVLRVRTADLAGETGLCRDASIPPGRSSWYIGDLPAAQTYRAELGVSTPDGRLISLLRSSPATLPPNGIASRRTAEAIDLQASRRAFPLVPPPPARGLLRASPASPLRDAPGAEPSERRQRDASSELERGSPPLPGRRLLGPWVLGRRVVEPDWEPASSSPPPTSPRPRSGQPGGP